MECKKMEKKLQDWARGLSFKLADGSAPPANYFALLTATPHRRQLWETLIESIQPREKVEQMRKQILVTKFTNKKKIPSKTNFPIITDKIDLWHKQNELENNVKNKKNESLKLEKSILMKASDFLFDICKLSEIEKIYEDSSESELALRLFRKREKNVMENLEKFLMKVMKRFENFPENSVTEKKIENLNNELLNIMECKNSFDEFHCCEFNEKLNEWCESGMETEENLWENVIKKKKNILEKFLLFLNELNSNEKTLLSEKESETEKKIKKSIIKLKENIMEKSLEVIVNSSEGNSLDYEIEKLKENIFFGIEKMEKRKISLSEIFNESISPIEENEKRESLPVGGEINITDVMNVMKELGLKNNYLFLKEKAQNLEEEIEKIKKDEKKEEKIFETSEKEFQLFENILYEIFSEENLIKNLRKKIIEKEEILFKILNSQLEEEEENKKMVAMKNAENLKESSGKFVKVFADTPIDAFRIFQNSDGRLLFEFESFSHCLINYGGELKNFFSVMLIPPEENCKNILSEIEKRKIILREIKKMIRCREEVGKKQKKIQNQINTLKWNTQLCERNFTESDAILWNALAKAEEIPSKIFFIENILRNWVEQPYRLMVNN